MSTPILDFVPGLIEDTDKYIEVEDVNYVTAKQKRQVQIIMCEYNGDPFIVALHNVLLVHKYM